MKSIFILRNLFNKRYKSGDFWYQLTATNAPRLGDYTKFCQEECGIASSIVDWSRDLKFVHERDEITSMMDALGIEQTFNRSFFLITYDGEDYFNDTKRKYFFENHGGDPPGNWLVHGQMGDISLGMWYVGGKILCKYPDDKLGLVLGNIPKA